MLIIVNHSFACNVKKNFLVLGKGDTFRINESFGAPQGKFSINLSKANTKFSLSLHYNADNSSLFVYKTILGNKRLLYY